MKKLFLIIGLVWVALAITTITEAADISAQLDDALGASAFVVKDSAAASKASVSSLGDVALRGYVKSYYLTEANPRWELNRDMGGGSLAGIGFGPGGATALDTKIWRKAAYELRTNAYLLLKDTNDGSLELGGGSDYNLGGYLKLVGNTKGGATTSVEVFLQPTKSFDVMEFTGWARSLRAWGGGGVRVGNTNADPGTNNLTVDGNTIVGGNLDVTGNTTVTGYIQQIGGGANTSYLGNTVMNYSLDTNLNITSRGGTSGDLILTAAGSGDVKVTTDADTDFNVGAGKLLVQGSNGYVGIGTTPGSALDVKGTLRLSGSSSGWVGFAPAAAAGAITYTLPSADGTTGQVLSTSGAAVLSWATAGGGGYTNLTQFVAQTPWRVFYSNTDGDVTELAFGNSGEFLKSNGTTSAPTWAAGSGGITDEEYNIVMSAQSLQGIEQIRHTVQAFQHYGNLAVDSFSDSTGIASGTGYTYEGSPDYDVKSAAGATTLASCELTDGQYRVGSYGATVFAAAQSFNLAAQATIGSVDFLLAANIGSPTGGVTITIETSSGGNPSGTLADANLTTTVASPTASAWNTATFASSGSVSASTVYWIVIKPTTPPGGDNGYQWCTDYGAGGKYADGNASKYENSWANQAEVDMDFRLKTPAGESNFQSVTYTFPSVPTKLGVTLKLSANTTDITVSVSRNAGTTFTSCALTQIGSTGYYRATSLIDVSGQSSASSVRYKINFANATAVKVRGVGVYGK